MTDTTDSDIVESDEIAPTAVAVLSHIVKSIVDDPEAVTVEVDESGAAKIRMTLTTPMCPAAEELPPEVESKIAAIEGVQSAKIEVTWEPPWNPDFMTEAARLELGMF